MEWNGGRSLRGRLVEITDTHSYIDDQSASCCYQVASPSLVSSSVVTSTCADVLEVSFAPVVIHTRMLIQLQDIY